MVPLGVSEGDSVLSLLSSFYWLTTILDVSWLVDKSLPSVSIFTWRCLLCVCLYLFPSSYKDSSHIELGTTLSTNKVTFIGSRSSNFNVSLQRMQFNLQQRASNPGVSETKSMLLGWILGNLDSTIKVGIF